MKEKIGKKLEELKKLRAELIGQINALNGAIQACEELLKPDEVTKEDIDGIKN